MSLMSGRCVFPSALWIDICILKRCLSIMDHSRTYSNTSKSEDSKSGEPVINPIKDWRGYLNSGVLSSISALNLELPNYEKLVAMILPKKSDSSAKVEDSCVNVQAVPKRKEIPPSHSQGYSFQEAMEEEMKTVSGFNLGSKQAPGMQIHAATHSDVATTTSQEPSVFKKQFPFLDKTSVSAETEKKVKQHKAWVSKTAIDNRTRALVLNLRSASTSPSRLKRAEELAQHLVLYPEARSAAVKEKASTYLLRLRARAKADTKLMEQIRETLSLLGHVDPVKGRGIRVLSIDGGGTRGIAALETLISLERRCNKEIHEMFDYVCGVSTGALIAAMISVFKLPLDECVEVYKQCSREMFSQGRLAGTTKLVVNHAFYDAAILENMLKENMKDMTMIQTSKLENVPKFAAVSCLVNVPVLTNYLFRNYSLPANVQPHYPGSFKHKMWEAIRASSAAPGYYEEFRLDDTIHQDGGLLTNNPTAIAIHECKLLWPHDSFQCVVSLGTGRYEGTSEEAEPSYSTLKRKLLKVVQSATDTEAVHTVLGDLLPPRTYYRFNPYMSEDFLLDEIREEKTEQLVQDTRMYLRKNEHKLDLASKQLLLEKRPHEKCRDWVKLQSEILR